MATSSPAGAAHRDRARRSNREQKPIQSKWILIKEITRGKFIASIQKLPDTKNPRFSVQFSIDRGDGKRGSFFPIGVALVPATQGHIADMGHDDLWELICDAEEFVEDHMNVGGK